jgi:hypothetical protein
MVYAARHHPPETVKRYHEVLDKLANVFQSNLQKPLSDDIGQNDTTAIKDSALESKKSSIQTSRAIQSNLAVQPLEAMPHGPRAARAFMPPISVAPNGMMGVFVPFSQLDPRLAAQNLAASQILMPRHVTQRSTVSTSQKRPMATVGINVNTTLPKDKRVRVHERLNAVSNGQLASSAEKKVDKCTLDTLVGTDECDDAFTFEESLEGLFYDNEEPSLASFSDVSSGTGADQHWIDNQFATDTFRE